MQREPVSGNHYSVHDQVIDAVESLNDEERAAFDAAHPEWGHVLEAKGSDAWLDDATAIAAGVNVEYMNSAIDWLEANTRISWDDGEPYLWEPHTSSQEIAAEWHGGQSSDLYAHSSTGHVSPRLWGDPGSGVDDESDAEEMQVFFDTATGLRLPTGLVIPRDRIDTEGSGTWWYVYWQDEMSGPWLIAGEHYEDVETTFLDREDQADMALDALDLADYALDGTDCSLVSTNIGTFDTSGLMASEVRGPVTLTTDG